MCGRYYFDVLRSKRLEKLHQELGDLGIDVKTGEVFPSDMTAVVRKNQHQIAIDGIKWGFEGFKPNQLIINARSESVINKQLFKLPFLTNRCVFPMSGFYEWRRDKAKYLFTYPDDQLIFVGGFIRQYSDGPRSIIMTTAPNEAIRQVHNRMPVLVDERYIRNWLFDDDYATNLLSEQMPNLVGQQVKSK
ncbi:MAG: SOS response-associated peptidase [Lentilactobacillus diolivorans]|jgi:putative SOS response-associated peptidase YedK|nr:SOS response-associated peptidase [Lentilactobacillus diolivorans]RRG03511.1 MAG: SOS response-associated peptidase [Lactobacillus sp.]